MQWSNKEETTAQLRNMILLIWQSMLDSFLPEEFNLKLEDFILC